MKDGVGERLITVNPTALNAPGFRNAGWGNPAEIRRTHSPPIPVGTSSEYFARAPRSAGDAPVGFNDGDDDPTRHGLPERSTRGDRIPHRMREVLRDDDDSSDASDDSDDEETVIQG